MVMKKVLVSALFAAGMIGAVATPLPSFAAVDLYVNVAPPPERFERVPEPRRGYVWAPGYWDWRNNHHVWVKGASVREREGYSYQPHRWVERDGRWTQERGRWNQAHRDSDGDGIPNNRDRHPNDPNRR
jgi:WXXGXW repeat (2 copies)